MAAQGPPKRAREVGSKQGWAEKQQMVLKLLERGEEGRNKLEAWEWLATRWSEWSGGDLSSASGRFSPGPSLWDQVLAPGPRFEEQS